MRTARLLLVILALYLQATPFLWGQSAYQVADIAPNTPLESQGGTVLPGYFQPVSGGEVYLDRAGTGFASIWRTDGTPEGTRPVVSGNSIGIGELIGSNGERAYFAGWDLATGKTSVWATDGTPEGTALLRGRLGPPHEAGFYGPDTFVADGRVFFHDCEPAPSIECGFWSSDGTVAGTRRLVGLGRRVTGVAGSEGRFYFLGQTETEFVPTIWRTDGTAEGTVALRSFSTGEILFEVASVAGEALVVAEGKLWITDGDSVHPVAALPEGSNVSFTNETVVGNALYFFAFPPHSDSTLTVWRSDGTAAGTSQVLGTPVHNFPSTPRRWIQQLGARVYYLMPGPEGREPYSLWSSQADGSGAQPVSCGGCSSIPDPAWIFESGGRLYFPSASGDVHSLWVVDAAHSPGALKDFCTTGSCDSWEVAALDGGLLFSVAPGLTDDELWFSDGTVSGTRSIGSFRPLYNVYGSANLDRVLFTAAPGFPLATGLWTTLGTPESTVPLSAPSGRGSQPRELRRAGDRVAFLACNPEGLWGAGAHDAELAQEGDVSCSSTDSFHPFVSAGENAFFAFSEFSTGAEVWATGGTAESTRRVWDSGFDATSDVYDMVEWGTDLLFWQSRIAGEERITSLWRSNGTAAGTSKLFDLVDEGPGLGSTALGEEIYFRTQTAPPQIWRTRGTAETTFPLTDDDTGEFVQDPEFTRVGAFVYFTGHQGIWRTNGTPAGTSLVIPGPVEDDIYSNDRLSFLHELGGALLFMRTEDGLSTLWRADGPSAAVEQIAILQAVGYGPRAAASLGGRLYFAADDGVHGIELWCTDGTAAGTMLVREFGPGPISGTPRELIVANGRLHFTADAPFSGSELWVSDGTPGGTHLVQDIAPFAASSWPADLTVVGDLLYFSAEDALTGRELWALPLDEPPAACDPGEEQLCLRENRFEIEVDWRDFEGRTGRGQADPLSGDTGFFWFFDDGIVELIVKVIDGRELNGHFWVFYGSLSNVEFTITITDKATGENRTYENPQGTFASVGDILAFPVGDSTPVSTVAALGDRLGTASATAVSGSCVPDSERLCLLDGRFAVEAVWTDFAGNNGTGTAVSLSQDTGYFWFFSPSNVEVVAKVIDGRTVNGKFWFFYGALSNTEFKLKVTDTVTGVAVEYPNPSGTFASVGDIDVF